MDIIPLEIDLNFNRKFFEEIYYKNNKGNILFGPQTKSYSISIIILTALIILVRPHL